MHHLEIVATTLKKVSLTWPIWSLIKSQTTISRVHITTR